MAASQEFVQNRINPLEMSIQTLTSRIDELTNKLASRGADVESAERRYEEISKTVERFGQELKSFMSDGTGESSKKPRNFDDLMRSPALRNVIAYSGDHRLFNKWRSTIRGVSLRCGGPSIAPG